MQLKPGAGYQGIEKILIATAKENDAKHFEKLLELDLDLELAEGQIYLFDCGYRGIKTYDRIAEAKSFFVTKLHKGYRWKVVQVGLCESAAAPSQDFCPNGVYPPGKLCNRVGQSGEQGSPSLPVSQGFR